MELKSMIYRSLRVLVLGLVAASTMGISQSLVAEDTAAPGWEVVNQQNPSILFVPSKGRVTERMRVPGGWIYQTTIVTIGVAGGVSTAMTFVPDRDPT